MTSGFDPIANMGASNMAASTDRTIAVVTAGLSQPSSTRLLADRLADSVQGALSDSGVSGEVRVIELRELAHEIADNMLTGFPEPTLEGAISDVTNADGLIVVTPIFSASYSGLFKSFFDVLDKESLTGKPTLLAATGGSARHSLALEHALRPLFAYLRAATVPTSVYAASADWGASGGAGNGLNERIDRAAGELAEAVALRPHRAPKTPEEELFGTFVPFEQLGS